MAREETKITRYICDRCQHAEQLNDQTVRSGDWSRMTFQTQTGGTIGGRYKLDDLCPKCTDNFERWMKNHNA